MTKPRRPPIEKINHPQPGIYALSRRVVNPNGDARVKHLFWRKPVWEAGTKFVVEPFDALDGSSSDVFVLRPASSFGPGDALGFVKSSKDRIDLIVPFLERVPLDTPANVRFALKEKGCSAERLLDRLLFHGIVTIEHLHQILIEETSR